MSVRRNGHDKRLEIQTDPETGMSFVTNLISMEVLDSKARPPPSVARNTARLIASPSRGSLSLPILCQVVESLLRRARKARATAATECNERSSRSHSIFTLKVRGVNEETQQEYQGLFVFPCSQTAVC